MLSEDGKLSIAFSILQVYLLLSFTVLTLLILGLDISFTIPVNQTGDITLAGILTGNIFSAFFFAAFVAYLRSS